MRLFGAPFRRLSLEKPEPKERRGLLPGLNTLQLRVLKNEIGPRLRCNRYPPTRQLSNPGARCTAKLHLSMPIRFLQRDTTHEPGVRCGRLPAPGSALLPRSGAH